MKTKLIAIFGLLSILSAVFGFLGNPILIVCLALVGIVAGVLIANRISRQLGEIAKLAEKAANGEVDKEISVDAQDEVGKLAASLKKIVNYQKDLAQALAQVAQGQFTAAISMRSEKDNLGKALQNCVNNGQLLNREIARIAEAAREGRLRERCKPDELHGAHDALLKNVNSIMDALVRPPGMALKALNKVVAGDLTARVEGTNKGDHAAFQEALNLTLKTLDESLSQAGQAANRVSSATAQISAGSQTLSQGASEQAASIEEVTSSLQEVAAMTRQNSENAREAHSLSKIAVTSVESGVESMERLSEAINRIKASSDSTAKIIKTIDEIAFQTNLLALNAAVEAARAGDAGKGFAVVAEEVRNLAMRCAEAAKNTASLIESSVSNSENGVALNQEVLRHLAEISGQAKQVGVVMENIAKASEQQTQAVEQVNSVISQMSMITQQVAANAEESASGSEQLFGLAEELKGMVYAFRLTDGSAGNTWASESHSTPERYDSEPNPAKHNDRNKSGQVPPSVTGGRRSTAADMIPFESRG